MVDYYSLSIRLHEKFGGKIEVGGKLPLESKEDLSVAYTPGVAGPCREIARDPERARKLTIKGNSVAVVTDGSAVLGLGNIGPEAALPVMEGKALLFKKYANIDAWPICLGTQNAEAIIDTVRRIAPSFGGINLEDIAAPKCFLIEEALQDLGIPVFHDDQHGTAIVVAAGLLNAFRVLGKDLRQARVVICGAGSAGVAIAKLLKAEGYGGMKPLVRDVLICDSKGILSHHRGDLTGVKSELRKFTNEENRKGDLKDALRGADVFIGVSQGELLKAEDLLEMNEKGVIFALANPVPEIWPEEARRGGAAIVATGRSDYPNQVNNVLAFPGIFRGALDAEARAITPQMKLAAVQALVDAVKEPTENRILPAVIDGEVSDIVADYVRQAYEGKRNVIEDLSL